MKKSVKYAAIIITSLAVVGSVAGCSHKYRSPEAKAEYVVKKVTSKLDLDTAQTAKLQKLVDTVMALRKERKAKKPNMKAQVRALLDKPTLDRKRTTALVREHTQFVNQNAPQVIAAFGDFYDSLTPAQQQKLRKHLDKHHQRGHSRGH